ncbi:MAG TPA: hypothetical protein VK977_09685, partial [Actinomycetota bacterium]|nr:hypothetical protein [Actinomycetota bacterium]
MDVVEENGYRSFRGDPGEESEHCFEQPGFLQGGITQGVRKSKVQPFEELAEGGKVPYELGPAGT